MIDRALLINILSQLDNPALPRGVILYGPRQVGKTTLVNQIISHYQDHTLLISGDSRDTNVSTLETCDWSKIALLISDYSIIVIDEAQRIRDIGLAAKLILDHQPTIKVILTGSSALDLASRVSEPLTGRAYSYRLWPISLTELHYTQTFAELQSNLEQRIIFGSYPKLITLGNQEDQRQYLLDLVDKYLYKDILDFGGIKNSPKVKDLLKLLAYQIGSMVSVTELATQLEISRDAVNNYLNLLESSFIIFRLGGYSHNLRKEMHKMYKIYFWDTGIRNALINQFDWKNTRHDWGQLWENFLIAERFKRSEYEGWKASYYYWRLSTGAEIDLIEQKGGALTGFEIKSSSKQVNAPSSWGLSYPDAQFSTINANNWYSFAVNPTIPPQGARQVI